MMNVVVGLTLLLGIGFVCCSPTGAPKNDKPAKCAPSDSQIGTTKKCFKNVVGKDPGTADDAKAWENEDTKTKIIACIFTEFEVLDESGFNADNAEKVIQEMKADEETKDALIEGMRKCTDDFEKEEVDKILACVEEENKSVCSYEKEGKS